MTWGDDWLTPDERRGARPMPALTKRPEPAVPRPVVQLHKPPRRRSGARIVQRIAQALAYALIGCAAAATGYGAVWLAYILSL